jgi:uncharacterized membrane protein YqgA involved in biofilm formation
MSLGKSRTESATPSPCEQLAGVVNKYLEYGNPLVPLVSVVAGLGVGELLGIEGGLKRFGDRLEKRFSRGESQVSRGFRHDEPTVLRWSLDGDWEPKGWPEGDYSLLALESALAFIVALTFASALGWGFLLSAGTVLVVKCTLTLGANFLDAVVAGPMISATTATGGILFFGLGLGLLDLKEGRVANMLPALLFAPLLAVAAPLWPF